MPDKSLQNTPLPTTLILMAAGDSTRFCKSSTIKKQWLRIESKPLWLFVADYLSGFYNFDKVIITASKMDLKYMRKMCQYTIIEGGKSRCESLQNALIEVDSEYVLVNDVARFDVPKEIVENLFSTMLEYSCDCVAPKVGISDTILYDNAYIDREKLFKIQTPQLSKTQTLIKALNSHQSTDESSAIKAFGGKVAYIQGSERLSKITFAKDIKALKDYAKCGTNANSAAFFIGGGIDVHSFEEGKKMMLGGVHIPSSFGFKAHSDGDVLLHALADSILGAMGAGDIGEWFPDTNPEFHNADSKMLLKEILDFAKSVGFMIQNLDVTLIAQIPKINPHKRAIQESLSQILEIPLYAINIKATTTENLGFIGRSEGVCAMCSIMLKPTNWEDLI